MAAILIVIEEHGFPVELAGPAIVRAIAERRLRAEMIVQVYAPGQPAYSCLAHQVPMLRPLFGIDDTTAQSSPFPTPKVENLEPSVSAPSVSWAGVIPMQRGQNIALPDTAGISLLMGTAQPDDSRELIEVDFSAFLLDANGRVRGDSDFVFYNNESAENLVTRVPSVRHREFGLIDKFQILLSDIDDDVVRISFTASIHDGDVRMANFSDVGQTTIAIEITGGVPIARFDLNEPDGFETALILGELYRRDGWWKFRAVGQGFAGGLAPLAKSFGLEVNDPE